MRELECDVLVIGGGPTGMVAALALARQGVSTIVLERQRGPQPHPKAHEVSGRTLEILAALGVPYDDLAPAAADDADASRILFCEALGREFGGIDLRTLPGADKYRAHLATPTGYLNLSQVDLERILARHVAAARIDVRHGHTWRALVDDGDAVVSEAHDEAGSPLKIRSRYVIAADGASSRVRAALGVRMIGPDKLQDFVSAAFDADLSRHVTTRGKIYFVYNPRAPGVLIAHHIERRWVYHALVATPHERSEDLDEAALRTRIREAVGDPALPLTITSMSPWRMTAQVAERLRVGRVFLAGDAAHRFPPTGGLGMNSGVADAHNLAWKLAAVLHGRAGDRLLDTYEVERRPVVQALCDESRANFERMDAILGALGVDPGAHQAIARHFAGRPLALLPARLRAWLRGQVNRLALARVRRHRRRPELARRLRAAVDRQIPHFDRLGLDLGLAYERGALIADGTPPPPPPADPVRTYRPTTRPGARFPHFWLDAVARRSSHTLLDDRRATLLLGAACEITPDERADLEAAALRLGAQLRPLADADISLAHVAAVHRHAELDPDGALLVRPDGHVAWRQRAGVRPSAALLESILTEALAGA